MADVPKFIHDTSRIVAVNEAGCALFRCDASALIDLDMMTLIVHEDFRGLARLRMKLTRQLKALPAIKYKLQRCDGTRFWATVTTRPSEAGLFESCVLYECEE